MEVFRPKRSTTMTRQSSFFQTMQKGFHHFHEFELKDTKNRSTRTRRLMTTPSRPANTTYPINVSQDHEYLRVQLSQNKNKFSQIKYELRQTRQFELNEYIRKSLKYQQILDINDNKKKRLPTLNSKIGEVIKKSVTENLIKNVQYQMTTTEIALDCWKPQSREGHTVTIWKGMAVVIGGHCSYPFANAQVFNLENNSWVKQFQVSSARSYHSATLYKNRYIIIFGGMGNYDISRKCRVCYNSINLIDLQTFSSRVLKMGNEEVIQGRRYHGCALMGKYMLVFGGMNTKRQLLKDFVYLDLKELKWFQKEFKVESKQLEEQLDKGIAKHRIVVNFANHKTLPLYSSQYNNFEGLYIFGGTFGNGYENILLFMSFNTYNPYLRKLQYTGIPPSSVQVLAEKISQNKIIILSGELSDRGIKIFKIRQKQFVGVYKYINQPNFGGVGSSLSNNDGEMYIFFGLGENGYAGSIYNFRVEEHIIENNSTKKKEKNIQLVQFKANNKEITQSSDS